MNSEVLEEIEHAGLTIKVMPDHEPPDPRDADQLGVMYCWHPDYTLGDEQFTHDDHPNARSLEDVEIYLRDERDAIVVLPLALLDHSGLSMRVGTSFREDSGGWDTTRCGFIYATKERCVELGIPGEGEDLEEIERQLRAEVEEYDWYLMGAAYGYVVESPEGEHLDSLWGFLGWDHEKSGLLAEAKASAECERRAIEREEHEADEWAARDVETVDA